jgi:hypothetical protein
MADPGTITDDQRRPTALRGSRRAPGCSFVSPIGVSSSMPRPGTGSVSSPDRSRRPAGALTVFARGSQAAATRRSSTWLRLPRAPRSRPRRGRAPRLRPRPPNSKPRHRWPTGTSEAEDPAGCVQTRAQGCGERGHHQGPAERQQGPAVMVAEQDELTCHVYRDPQHPWPSSG